MSDIRFGFSDARTSAELMLAPGRPLSVSVLNFGGLKLGPVSLNTIGAISSVGGASKLSPAMFTNMRAQLQQKAQLKGLSASVNASLHAYRDASQLVLQGQTALRDTVIFGTSTLSPSATTGAVTSFFPASDLVQLSGMRVGNITGSVTARAAAASQYAARGAQLAGFASSIASTANSFKMAGVRITENFNRQPRPTDDELDAPSTPALARGGAAAEKDTARKTKKELTVRAIKTAIPRPKSWARNIGTAKEPWRSYKLTPGFNAVTGMVFAADNTSQPVDGEPLATFNPQFPYNKSTVSESGHLFELDDTPGATRVHLYHRSGTNIEMHHTVTHGDDVIRVEGHCKIHVDQNVSLYAKGEVNIQSDKGVNINTTKDFTVHAENINLRAKKTSTVDGTTIDLRYVKLPGVPVHTPSGMAPRLSVGALKADYPTVTARIEAQKQVDRKLNTAYRKRILAKLATAATAAGVAVAVRDLMRVVEFTQFGSFSPNIQWPQITQPVITPPQENPLSNPLIYSTKSYAASVYRGRLFDTPEEVNNAELYQAHIDTRRALGDITTTGIAIPGERSTPTFNRVTPISPRVVSYVNRDVYRDVSVRPSLRLGDTTFTLANVVDTFHSPDVSNFITDPITLSDGYQAVTYDDPVLFGDTQTQTPTGPLPGETGSCENGRYAGGWDYLGSCAQGCASGADACGEYASEYQCMSANYCI
jgi:hypothetical protein